MPKEQIVVGLDMGSTKAVVCVGTIKEGVVDIIGISKKPSTGLRRGTVVDIEETVSAITATLEEAERMAGIPINNVYASIGGTHITSANSRGVIAVSRADGEISEADVERVLEAARTVAMPPNQEILHVIPKYYIVDDQEQVKDPLGMTGVRLEVETLVIGVSTSAIKNLAKCIKQTGLGINDLIFTSLASAKVLLSKKQKEIGVMLLDIGANTTQLAIFEEGNLIHAKVLPVGAEHITNDIAIGLRTSIEAAEKIKVKYANADSTKLKEVEQIKLASFDPTAEEKVSKKYIAEIVEARLTEIFSMVRDELKEIRRDGMLPAGVVLTGGGAKLHGLVEFSKEYLRLPTQIGYPTSEVAGMVDKLDDPSYTASVGLMLWGLDQTHREQGKQFKINSSSVNTIVDKAKDIFKQFMP